MDCHLQSFFNQQAIQSEDSVAIKKLNDNSTEINRSLEVIEMPTEHWDAVIVHIMASKLDSESHKQWELKLTKDNIPTFK